MDSINLGPKEFDKRGFVINCSTPHCDTAVTLSSGPIGGCY